MDESPKIYRAFVSGSIGDLILVLLDKHNKNSSEIASFAQSVLHVPSTYNLGDEWPIEDVFSLQQLLSEVDPSLAKWSERAMYVQHGHFHAVGLGRAKRQQEKAALLGLTLQALLCLEDAEEFPAFAGRRATFAQEVTMARRIPVKEIRPPTASSLAVAAQPRISVKEDDVVELPEDSLLRRLQGITVPWMPARPGPLTIEDVSVEPVSEQIFSQILTQARASLEEELRKQPTPQKGRFSCNLRSFPWACIIAGHAEKERIVGKGITSFNVVMDEKMTDPLQEAALVFFEAKQQNGEVYTFHSLERCHQPMRWDRTEKALTQPRPLRDDMLQVLEAKEAPKFYKLDPATYPAALKRFSHLVQTFTSWSANVRYSHASISGTFLHGHRGQPIDNLMSQLESASPDALNIPPLVAVEHQGLYYVIFGNRRLYAYKNCGVPVLFKMIVHSFPEFHGASPQEKQLLCTKTLLASSSTTGGREVAVRRKCPSHQQAAVERMPKRPAEFVDEVDEDPVDAVAFGLQPCPKPRPKKKAMPRPAKSAEPVP